MTSVWRRVARAAEGEGYARAYARRFAVLAAEGADVHGEATYVAGLVPPGARVLDAGCGTGRVAVRLAELGYAVTGVDVDASMVAVAREDAPDLDWRVADLATLDLGATYDVVLVAGNVPPLLEPGTLPEVARRLAAHLADGGRLVCGYGLDPDHLPDGAAVVPLEEYDAACADAGLVLRQRLAGWDATPYDGAGYAVSVHARSED